MINVKEKVRQNIHIDKKILYAILEFSIGFALTRSVVLLSILPIGISFSLAIIKRNGRIYSMCGAFLGYLLLNDINYGFRYAGVLLIISALLNLTKVNVYALILVIMPTFAIVDMLINGFSYTMLILMVTEVVICASSTFLYNKMLESDKKYRKVGVLFFLATLISALSGVTIFFNIAPVRIFAVLLILISTYFAKSGAGCIISVIFGVAMDSTLGTNSAIFTMAYSFASVISGALSNMNKVLFSSVFTVMYGVSAIFGANSPYFIASLIEVGIAGVLFIIIPTSEFLFIKEIFEEPKISYSNRNDKIFDITSNASSILNQMSKVLTDSIEKIGELSYNDINKVYLATTEKVCKNCEIRHKCWNIDYINSIDALNSATSKSILRGYFLSTDFPSHFSTRCINFVDLLNDINSGIMSLSQNKHINETLQSNKKAISNQCTAISSILKDITYSATNPVENFPYIEEEIQKEMNKYSLSLNVLAYNDASDKFFVEIIGKNTYAVVQNLPEVCKNISSIVTREMEFMSQVIENGATRVVLHEKNKYKLEISTKVISKHRISGDVTNIFDNGNDCSYVVLSDGMGSGYRANNESIQVVELLSKMLRSGVGLTKSLKGISPLVSIKNNDKNFVALDVISVDLNVLECALAKYGAAPTYIFREGKVHKISSTNLPLGLGYKSEISRVNLVYNDIILMMSDGILSTDDDDFIVEILKNSDNKTCEEICNEILEKSVEDDDKTIIVIKVNLNK